MNKIKDISAVIDLNAILYNRRSFALQGATDEHPADRLRPDHGLSADDRIPKMRPALSWQLQSPKILLLRSVFLPGFCPTDLQGKPPLASGTVLPLDQTKLADQIVLWDIGECHKKADLGGHRNLRSRRNHQEKDGPEAPTLQYFAEY
jgi:hypothetical protein